MSIAYGVECQQLDLMVSHLAASHGWPRRIEDEHNKRRARLIGLFRDALDQGVASGELRADADLDLFVSMLLDIYVRNYRRANNERLSPEDLSALTKRQHNLLFAGVAAESAEAPARSAQG